LLNRHHLSSINQVRALAGTPCFVYDLPSLKANAQESLAFPNAFGLTARFAMKACPNAAVLRLFASQGLHFDCSSNFEVWSSSNHRLLLLESAVSQTHARPRQ
jgi:diaminopimelate decarboxylase